MIYSGTIDSKTGHKIPVFNSGKPAHSKYNPTADKILLPEDACGCVLVFGIGAGFHISNIAEDERISKVIGIEADKESLEFCRKLESVREIEKEPKVKLCSFEDLNQCVSSNYLPALHKKLITVFLRSWHDEFPDASEKAKELLDSVLESISQDYSVQAHFGRHWHRNILTNLRFMSSRNLYNKKFEKPKEKLRAAIIAAGPTLDNSIEILKSQRKSTFIVSTDTAYGTLLKYGMEPDAVVSVDAQQVSSEHFLGTIKSNTLFIFDIATNPETVRLVADAGNSIYFIRSNHPLSALIKEETNIPFAETGSGTVTIAAADWARQQDFREIEFFGADFAYSDGKPYCKGTYLDKRFNSTSSRVSSSENKYTSLMFRTEIEKTDTGLLGKLGRNAVTSKVLASYGTTLLQWASKYGMIQKGNLFKATKEIAYANATSAGTFEYKKFIKNYIDVIREFSDRLDSLKPDQAIGEILKTPELLSLLPLFAAFSQDNIREDISLALHFLLYYNL